jgi:hypothetical protein
MSDLHLEFIKPTIERFLKQIPPGLDEICILAGDIGNPYQPDRLSRGECRGELSGDLYASLIVSYLKCNHREK